MLKTYVTSLGFFEMAVAAPSMKAALQAWGAERNLFHQGFAKETDDPAIVGATMAQPGVILKRAVGSLGAFREQAELPKSLPAGKPTPKQLQTIRIKVSKHKTSTKVFSLAEARAARQATAAFEREQARREADERKQPPPRASVRSAKWHQPERKRPLKRPAGATMNFSRRSGRLARPSTSGRTPKTRGGIRKRKNLRTICGAQESESRISSMCASRFLTFLDEATLGDQFGRLIAHSRAGAKMRKRQPSALGTLKSRRSQALLAPVVTRKHLGKLRAQQKNLRRIVDPNEQND